MELVSAFRTKWQPKAPMFIQYLDNQYFDPLPPPKDKLALDPFKKMKKWMFCFRHGVSFSRIHTNNYVESWHNLLKKRFFMDYHRRRVDHVIFILDQRAIYHSQHNSLRFMSRVNASPGKRALDRAVKQAMVYFNEVRDADDAYVPFEQHSDYADKLKVFSFTFSSQHYNVSVEWDGPSLKHIRSSSCERQHQTNECCKHIGILLYLFEGSSFVGNPHHGLTSEQTDEQSVEQLAVASQEPLNLETGYDTRDLEEASEFLTRCFLEKKYGEWSAEAASLVKRTRDAFEEMYDAGEGGKRRAREDKQYRRQRS